ncbi:MAG: hypothetical protein ABI193_00965 [Minicystis sp.]
MSWVRRAAGLAAGLALTFGGAGHARAETTAATTTTSANGTGGFYHNNLNIKVSEPTRSGIDRRGTTHNPEWVSHADCAGGLAINFDYSLLLGNDANGHGVSRVEVWMSHTTDANCLTNTSRDSINCRQIFKGGLPIANPPKLAFDAAKDIVVKGLGYDSCDVTHSSSADPTYLWFLMIRSGVDTVADADYARWDGTQVDLWGPEAPSQPTVTAGDESLSVEITSSDSDTARYWVFRDPPPDKPFPTPTNGVGGSGGAATTATTAATGSGGAGGIGGAGGAGGSSASCLDSTWLIPGKLPSDDLRARIAVALDFATSGTTTKTSMDGLTNNVNYGVAVAGVDTVGNVGVLSPVSCAVPRAVDSFFKVYCRDGGTCNGCSFGTDHGFGWPAIGAGVALAFGLGVRRRARRAARARKVAS